MPAMNKQLLKELKQRTHSLKPVVIVGSQALSSSVHAEIDRALNDHELIKIRVNANNKDERSQLIHAICKEQKAELVNHIGHTIIIYRALVRWHNLHFYTRFGQMCPNG